MTRRTTAIAVVMIAAVAAVGGTIAARWNSPVKSAKQEADPVLHVAADKLTVGVVWETDRFEWTIPIANRGPSTVAVSRVQSSCNCLIVAPDRFSIEPGKSHEVRLAIDLRGKLSDPAASQSGFSVSVEFTFTNEPGYRPVEKVELFTVTGQVKRALLPPQAVYVGTHSELAKSFKPVAFSVDSLVRLTSLKASPSRADFHITELGPDGSGKRYNFELSLASPPSKGPIEGWILLDGITADGVPVPTTRVRVHGAIVDDIQSEPRELVAGSRPTGSTYESSLSLHSLVGNAFQVQNVTAEGEGLEVTDWNPAEPEVRVRQRVLKAGQQTSLVRAVVQSKGRSYTIEVPVICFGVDGLGE